MAPAGGCFAVPHPVDGSEIASLAAASAEDTQRVYGDTIPYDSSNSRIPVIKQPVGLVSARC
jgi:hypothetical protein